jgi:anaerobic magnesium-protoporphyrin IX monomethyl ester cyclase
MLKVALVKPYQPAVCNGMSPPLGVLYLAASLRRQLEQRVAVQALDARLYSLSPEEVVRNVRDADVVGLSVENLEARVAKEIAVLLKRLDPSKIVVVGGPYAHYRGEEVLETCPDIDWAFDGESDLVFPEAIRRLADGEPFDGIRGMHFRRDGEIVNPVGVDTVLDLDALPIAAWDLVDFEAYGDAQSFNVWRKKRLYGSLFTSRGCPYKCAYCHDIFGKKFRWRSAEHVLREITMLVDQYGVEEFQIVDDIFNLHKPRLKKIFAGLEERYGVGRLRFCFPNGLRGDILTEDVLQTLKRGGTYEITVAIETVTPRLQTLVQKNLDIPKVGNFIDYCWKEGILVRGFFMLGFPTESVKELLSTVWYALRSHLTFAAFFTVIPQPETPLYDLAKNADEKALAQVNQDDYYQGRSWYELATGFPLRFVTTFAVLAFYFLSPLRMLRIFRSIPLWNMGHIARQFVSFLLGRDVAERLGRERLRKYRPDIERGGDDAWSRGMRPVTATVRPPIDVEPVRPQAAVH